MEYQLNHGDPLRQRTGCLVVGVPDQRRLSGVAAAVDAAGGGFLQRLLRRGDFRPKPGETLLLPEYPGVRAARVLLVGCGKRLDADTYRKALRGMASALTAIDTADAFVTLADVTVRGRDREWRLSTLSEVLEHAAYRFDRFRSQSDSRPTLLRTVYVGLASRRGREQAEAALSFGSAIGEGTALTRDLANTPANVCTPGHLAEQAGILAEQHTHIHSYSLDRAAMEELGMHALLAVTYGSVQPPRLIVLEYDGVPDRNDAVAVAPIALIGKGITFDSGGISLKGSASMHEMKYDMAGAASVFGVLRACARARLPIRVTGVVPAVENMPDGAATRPGDIVTSLSGQTIEVLNTDAEGRMVLADAITWAERLEPRAIIDIATLTGASVTALGHHRHALMGNTPSLIRALEQAGEHASDPAWELPLDDAYDEQLRSAFADMANIGGRSAGAITAGCFLGRFARAQRWAHLDIAGTAWRTSEPKGATGRPVPLLMRYLARCCSEDRK